MLQAEIRRYHERREAEAGLLGMRSRSTSGHVKRPWLPTARRLSGRLFAQWDRNWPDGPDG